MALFAGVGNPLCDASVLHVTVPDSFEEFRSYLQHRLYTDVDVTTNGTSKLQFKSGMKKSAFHQYAAIPLK